MLGRLDPSRKEVTVVGAGISGLFTAYALNRRGYKVEVMEAKPRCGGMLTTTVTAHGYAEAAANSFVLTPTLKELAQDAGIRFIPLRHRDKYIFRDGKMRCFPLNFGETLAMLWAMLTRPTTDDPNMTCADFARRHWGEAALKFLMQPLVTGIYGASADELDLASCFPRFQLAPGSRFLPAVLLGQKKRGEAKGARLGVVYPEGGMQQFCERLATYLEAQGVKIQYSTSVADVSSLTTPNKILALPAPDAARLIATTSPQIADVLREVRYTPLISVSVYVERTSIPKPLRGLGVLVPAAEKLRVLGVLFSSASFPSRCSDPTLDLLTVILGGSKSPHLLNALDEDLRRIITEDLNKIFGASIVIKYMQTSRWNQAIPLYDTRHKRALRNLSALLPSYPGLLLTGSYAGEVSMRGILNAAENL